MQLHTDFTPGQRLAARALTTLCRIDAAIALGTVFTPRLAELRRDAA